MKWVLAAGLILAAVAAYAIFANEHNEVQSRHFRSLDEANQEHAIDKGWIPSFTPPGARDLQLEFDSDSGTVHGDFVADDRSTILKACQPRNLAKSSDHTSKLLQTSLESPANHSPDIQAHDEVLDCRAYGFSVAMAEASNKVSFWAAPRGE